MIKDALAKNNHADAAYLIESDDYRDGSNRPLEEWQGIARRCRPLKRKRSSTNSPRKRTRSQSSRCRTRSAAASPARWRLHAIAAIMLCLIGIIAYVWFRFHGVIYGIAAVVALIHDVLVTLGFVALSAYFVNGAGSLASLLLVDKFQINLTLVAAFLTIIGYSLNDTIVIFDRIREVKGKSPRLTREMINLAVNQTLGPDDSYVVHHVDERDRAVHFRRRRHSRVRVRPAGRLHRRLLQHDLHRQSRAAVVG